MMEKKDSDKKTFGEIFSFPTLPNVSDYPRRVKEMMEELKKFQERDGYFVSVDNGSSNYNIYSTELKNSLRNIIFSDEFWKGKSKGQRFTEGSFFSYKEGISDTPDIFKVKDNLLENEVIPPQIQGTSFSQIVEIDDEDEKLKAEGVRTISSQEAKKKQSKNKKEAEDKLNAIQEGQSKKDNGKKDKGGNAGFFVIGSGFVSLLTFGLFLVGR